MSTLDQTTRTRPMRSASHPEMTPPMPIPIRVYVLSAPALTLDKCNSLEMAGSASASI